VQDWTREAVDADGYRRGLIIIPTTTEPEVLGEGVNPFRFANKDGGSHGGRAYDPLSCVIWRD